MDELKVLYDDGWIGRNGIGRFATELAARNPGWIRLGVPGPATSPTRPIRLARRIQQLSNAGVRPPSVFFSPGYLPPAWCRIPVVVTVHDLMYLPGGGSHSWSRAQYFRLIRSILRRGRCGVVTVSEDSASRLRAWAGSDLKVWVVGNGISPAFGPDPVTERVAGRVLIVASERPNKNLARQLTAVEYVGPSVCSELVLVLPRPPSKSLAGVIAAMSVPVTWHTNVTDEQLASQFRTASALLVASLDEGFGMPALEAMVSGCPVIHSARGGLKEVVAEHGIVVDPTSIASIASGIQTALSWDVVVRSRIEGASASTRRFSWDETSQRVVVAIEAMACEG